MSEQAFLEQIDPFREFEYFYFVPADLTLGQYAHSRAYIYFKNQDDVFLFKDKFDGYVFVDNKGAEYPAVVEFAPFQSLPRNRFRKKNDSKCGTILADPHYINFIESLNSDKSENGKTETKLEFSYQFKDDDKKTIKTPLLEYLANKKQEKRDDRKRRVENRRKQREEERQRKRNNTAKNIPPPIDEEKSVILVNEDDIMVRTIKSRPLDRNRHSKKDRDRDFERDSYKDRDRNDTREKEYKNRADRDVIYDRVYERSKSHDDNRKSQKDFKRSGSDYKRNTEKDTKRQDSYKKENRDQDKETIKEECNKSNTNEPSVSISTMTTKETSSTKEEAVVTKRDVKKYSEYRRERRERESNKNLGKSETDSNKKESMDYIEDSFSNQMDSSSSSKDNNNISRHRYDDRAARRIRNKDRPSIEIYRPGQLRSTKKPNEDNGNSENNNSDEKSNANTDIEKTDEKPNTKIYEMSPNIPPFIPKSKQINTD